ncbi:MAG: mRNA turnover and ribosome assembly protein [Phylliscum demangeonii]|nr:MAG: mRNA turnover and ribosome assembly protein [Phylliscum demangeonii]
MPKSKRAKVVHTSRTDKKGKELNVRQFGKVRECLDAYPCCFVFSVDNMRNVMLKDVRQRFRLSGRLFFGKTKVMAKALGTTAQEEYQSNLSQLSQYVHGNVGLLFTSLAPREIQEFFDSYAQPDYARAGTAATRRFAIPAGIVHSRAGKIAMDEDVPVPHTYDTVLRDLGVPTRLDKGRVMLDQQHVVCREGEVLDSKQTRLLKIFGVQTVEFRVRLLAYWTAASGLVKEVDGLETRDARPRTPTPTPTAIAADGLAPHDADDAVDDDESDGG